jgi:hypothetical protein
MRFHRAPYTIEMVDQPDHTFGSTDNVRSYRHECAPAADFIASRHGFVCTEGGEVRGSAVIGGGGGATTPHEHSCVMLDDRCFVALGDSVCCLALPDLALLWRVQGDDATCFGLHLTHDERFLIVHGELEMRKLGLDGGTVWRYSGRDIFTGECVVGRDVVTVTDFEGGRYAIDLESGRDQRC